MAYRTEFCRTSKHYKLAKQADRILAKAGFFKPAATELEFPNDPVMQEHYDKLVGSKGSADAISPHGHLRATWTGKIQPTDALASAKKR